MVSADNPRHLVWQWEERKIINISIFFYIYIYKCWEILFELLQLFVMYVSFKKKSSTVLNIFVQLKYNKKIYPSLSLENKVYEY